MNRAKQIEDKMAELQEELDNLAPHEKMGVRELARAAGVGPSTAARFKEGKITDMQVTTLVKFMPFVCRCPLCGADSDPSAWGATSTPTPQADDLLTKIEDTQDV